MKNKKNGREFVLVRMPIDFVDWIKQQGRGPIYSKREKRFVDFTPLSPVAKNQIKLKL